MATRTRTRTTMKPETHLAMGRHDALLNDNDDEEKNNDDDEDDVVNLTIETRGIVTPKITTTMTTTTTTIMKTMKTFHRMAVRII